MYLWCSSVGLVFFFWNHLISIFLASMGVNIWWSFCFQYLDKITLTSISFRMVLIQIIARIYKNSLTLKYPPKIKIWLVSQFWYPHVGSLIPLLMFIVNTTHLTYTLVQHWFVLQYSPNHTPIKYKCLIKKSSQITPTYLTNTTNYN